jgi:hypothetical protein
VKMPPCPKCGEQPMPGGPRALAGNHLRPRDGDLGVCGQCGELLEIYDGGQLRSMTRATTRRVSSRDLAIMYVAQAWARQRAGRPVP